MNPKLLRKGPSGAKRSYLGLELQSSRRFDITLTPSALNHGCEVILKQGCSGGIHWFKHRNFLASNNETTSSTPACGDQHLTPNGAFVAAATFRMPSSRRLARRH
jgi:hypothetical protein